MKAAIMKKYLKTSEVVKLLEERGIKITSRTLRRYVQKKLIPEDMVRIEQRGWNIYYFFDSDVVDFLVERIPKKIDAPCET